MTIIAFTQLSPPPEGGGRTNSPPRDEMVVAYCACSPLTAHPLTTRHCESFELTFELECIAARSRALALLVHGSRERTLLTGHGIGVLV